MLESDADKKLRQRIGIIRICVFRREKDSPVEVGLLIEDEGGSNIHLIDQYGDSAERVWDLYITPAFTVNVGLLMKECEAKVKGIVLGWDEK